MNYAHFIIGIAGKLIPERLKVLLRRTRLYYFYDRRRRQQGVYTEEFYSDVVDVHADQSAPIIAGSLISEFGPRSVLDVGCGTGSLLSAFMTCGTKVLGLEYSDIGLRYCRAKGVPVQKFDLEKDHFKLAEKYDLVASMEVAEHLKECFADRYVQLLCMSSDVVVFTAATPGQRGVDHVNEQPNEYWIAKFCQHGFDYLEDDSARLRTQWESRGVTSWYHKNLMMFRKRDETLLPAT